MTSTYEKNKLRVPYVCYRKNNLGIRIVHTIAPWFRVQPLSYRLIGVDIYYVHSHHFVKEYYKITRHTLPLVLRSQQISSIPLHILFHVVGHHVI